MYSKINKRKLGADKEQVAVDYLKGIGYDILETNFRTRYEEIDIVARDGKTLVFVEVKYRKNDSFGSPLEAVNYYKQRRISMGAVSYLSMNNMSVDNTAIRFDAVGICRDEITHIKNAFSYVGFGYR